MSTAGTLIWDLEANTQKLEEGIKSASEQVNKLGKETESMSASISDSMKKAGDSANAMGDNLIKIGALPTAALVATTFRASEFQATMSDISTLISGDSTEAVKTLSDEVLTLSKRMPKSIDELGGSLYDILSAGIQGSAQQMQVLENSAKLATAGLGDTKGATDLMTSSINAFGLDAANSDKIADVLFKTVKSGKTTVDQLAMSFGATAPVIASAGISLEGFQAATAALTTTGLPASQAQNSLRQATVSLIKPTKEMADLLAKAGFESGEAALQNIGLVDTMIAVTDAADGNTEALAKAWGSVEALGASTALTGQVNEAYTQTLKDMKTGTGALGEAFDKQGSTSAAQMALLKNNIDALSITIGTALLPSLNQLIQALLPIIEKMAEFASNNPELVTTVLAVGTAIGGLGITFKIIGSLISVFTGPVGLLIKALPILKGFAIALGTAIAGLSVPVLIAIGVITALIAVGVLLYKNWDKVKEVGAAAFNYLKTKIADFANWASGIFEKIGEAMQSINPFHRNSPSLVDNVKNGLSVIKKQYASMGSISLPVVADQFPTMGSIGMEEGTATTSNSSSNVNVNIENVNNVEDVDMIAREIGFRLSIL